MKKFLSLILALALALSLVPGALAEDNVLKYGTETEPAGFDPHTISSHASIRIMAQVYNQLVDVNENLEVVPELATSWEISEDNLTYTFHLADNVYFHSGRKMTAEVKWGGVPSLRRSNPSNISAARPVSLFRIAFMTSFGSSFIANTS